MELLLTYQWYIFITLEILFIVSFLTFGFIRYFLNKRKLSLLFLGLFFSLIAAEALLALVVYQQTGEFTQFQLIIIIFVIYALTFGIFDFLKLDRWMRKKIGSWRNTELLTEKDYVIMERNKNPKYIAKKYRTTSTIHLIAFLIGQSLLWYYGTGSFHEMFNYIRDLSWIQLGNFEQSPYANETTYSIGMLWGIIFFVDFIWSWSYTLFPAKEKK